MTIEDFARAIPKIELHLHLEGAVLPSTFVALAEKNGLALPPFDDVMELYRYGNLLDFLKIYDLVSRSVQKPEDFHRITYEALASAASGGARYVEFFFSPHAHLASGITYPEMLDGIIAGMHDAKTDKGVVSLLIPAHAKPLGPEKGLAFVEMVAANRRDEVIGIGTDYDELPDSPAVFKAMYDRARELGLHVTAHAGEVGPAEFVREAIDDLKVERVDHGYNVVDDPALVARCRDEGVFFTCCPSTTLYTTTFTDLASPDHAIRRMIDAGLKVTLNTDDPPMFGTNISDEFALVARTLRLTPAEFKACTMNAIDASWLDEGTKRSWRTEWSAEIDRLAKELVSGN